MKKYIMILLFVFAGFVARTQKNLTAGATVNFNFGAKGFRLNDAGAGAEVHANFFANRRWQLRTDAAVNRFFADKLATIDANGNIDNFNPTVISAGAGPEYFASKVLSVAAMYGVAHYKRESQPITSGSVKLALTAHAGKTKRILTGVAYTALLKTEYKAHYFGLSFGYRFL